jgi:hypothetical protein
MATVWDPADKTTNITLSSGNHIATTTGGAGNEGVRASPTYHGASGKWYLEYTGISFGHTSRWGFTSAMETLGDTAGVLGIDTAGWINAGAGGPCGDPTGHTVCFAMDFDNKKMWVRYDGGAWVGNGGASPDPATDTNGVDITGFTSPVVPYFYGQFSGDTGTLNCGDSAFVQAIPSGFTAWDSIPPPPPVSYGQVIC